MSADAGLSFSSADVVSHSTIGAVFGRRDIATGPTGLALTRAALRYWTGANFSHLKGAAKTNKEKQHGEHSAREEGLQVGLRIPPKRAGVSPIPPIDADAPNMVWKASFQFNSAIDGKVAKITSVASSSARSPPSELEKVFIAAGRAAASTTAGQPVELVFPSATTVLLRKKSGVLHSVQHAGQQRVHRIVPQSTSQGVPQPHRHPALAT